MVRPIWRSSAADERSRRSRCTGCASILAECALSSCSIPTLLARLCTAECTADAPPRESSLPLDFLCFRSSALRSLQSRAAPRCRRLFGCVVGRLDGGRDCQRRRAASAMAAQRSDTQSHAAEADSEQQQQQRRPATAARGMDAAARAEKGWRKQEDQLPGVTTWSQCNKHEVRRA